MIFIQAVVSKNCNSVLVFCFYVVILVQAHKAVAELV